jgi:hypothetical protein
MVLAVDYPFLLLYETNLAGLLVACSQEGQLDNFFKRRIL